MGVAVLAVFSQGVTVVGRNEGVDTLDRHDADSEWIGGRIPQPSRSRCESESNSDPRHRDAQVFDPAALSGFSNGHDGRLLRPLANTHFRNEISPLT
jgi:hypothetical protein